MDKSAVSVKKFTDHENLSLAGRMDLMTSVFFLLSSVSSRFYPPFMSLLLVKAVFTTHFQWVVQSNGFRTQNYITLTFTNIWHSGKWWIICFSFTKAVTSSFNQEWCYHFFFFHLGPILIPSNIIFPWTWGTQINFSELLFYHHSYLIKMLSDCYLSFLMFSCLTMYLQDNFIFQ